MSQAHNNYDLSWLLKEYIHSLTAVAVLIGETLIELRKPVDVINLIYSLPILFCMLFLWTVMLTVLAPLWSLYSANNLEGLHDPFIMLSRELGLVVSE